MFGTSRSGGGVNGGGPRVRKRQAAASWCAANARPLITHSLAGLAVYAAVTLSDARSRILAARGSRGSGGGDAAVVDATGDNGAAFTDAWRELKTAAGAPPLAEPPTHSPAAAAAAAAGRRAWVPQPKPHPWRTDQMCYMLPDDSEFCEYDGPVCFAGENQIVVLNSAAPLDLRDRPSDTHGGACADYRYWEPIDSCGYSFIGGSREWMPRWGGNNAAAAGGDFDGSGNGTVTAELLAAAARADLPSLPLVGGDTWS